MAMERAVFGRQSKTEIISISENEKKRYMDCYGTEKSRFHCVPPGISKKRLAPANAPENRDEIREKFFADENTHIVLMVGSGFKTKGVDRAVRAISALPERLKEKTLLVIVGKGKTRPYLRLAKRLGVLPNIHFMGQRDDVAKFMAGADLLLHPSYHENTGTVLIEAMAAGLPVLATGTCGYGSHVKRAGAGRLVPSPFRQETLNNMLASMLSDKQMEQWGKNGKKYVAETDVYSMHQKAAEIIETVAAGRRFS
ncbi:MAG: glycosyltransferase family 4 protein [Desulfobacterales bacterium]|nr:glycosyltransferase family 4 protein [Desulfobacterales bacterium]